MLKPVTVVALIGALATPALADHYKSGVAMPRDLLPPVSDEPRFGPEGGGSRSSRCRPTAKKTI